MMLQQCDEDLVHMKSAIDRVRDLALLACKNGEPADSDDMSRPMLRFFLK
jgi:hypothetical protein